MSRENICHYKGASNELRAASYYLDLGFQVYFPVCQQGAVDFIVDKGSQGLLKVQVKTATWVKAGNNKYLQSRTRLTNKYQDIKPIELYDIFFVVSDSGLWEIPSSLIKSSNLCLQNTGKNRVQWQEFKVRE